MSSNIYIEIGGTQAGEVISGERVSGWSGLQVVRSIDSGADAFSFAIPWNPTAENIARFRPYENQQIVVKADNEKIITGYLELPSFTTAGGERSAILQGRGVTGVLIDWSAGPPFQFSGLTFNQIAQKIAFPYTVKAIPDTAPFADVEIEPGQSIFDFLSILASANGYFARPTAGGTLEYVTISDRKPVADIVEGNPNVISISTGHDVTKLHSEYIIVASTDGNPDISATVRDRRMPINIRGTKIISPRQESTDYDAAARLARSLAMIDSYTCNATVRGWRHGADLWRAGDIARVRAPGAFIVKPTLLIVRRATLQLDESGGQITSLDLALPETYSNTYPEVLPWED